MLHLRRGVRFHDGHELTSADVAHTFNSLIDPTFISARRGAYALLDRLRPSTLHRTIRPQGAVGLVPDSARDAIVPASAGPELRTRPIGTGPYRFSSYAVDDRLDLAAFPDYYGGAPQNAGLVLKIVPDEIMRGLELQKGTVDLIVNDLSPDTVEQFREEGSMQIAASPGTDYAYVGFNLRDPILADKRVRQAIGYAIDRDAIVKYLRRGLAQPAVSLVPPSSWAFAPDAFQFTHDPARARALLDEAGYRDPDGDGPEPRLRLTLKVSTNEFYRLQAAVIQQDLRAAGIELDVRSYEFATLSKDVAGGNFQLVTLQWVGISDPDMLRRVFHSKQMPPSDSIAGSTTIPRSTTSSIRRRRRPTTRPEAVVSGGAAESVGRRAVHQPLVQDERRRGAARSHRHPADAAGCVHLSQGCFPRGDGRTFRAWPMKYTFDPCDSACWLSRSFLVSAGQRRTRRWPRRPRMPARPR